MSVSSTCDQSHCPTEQNLPDRATLHLLDQASVSIINNEEESRIIKNLEQLPWCSQGSHLQAWRQPTFSLNLLQLAVLHGQGKVVQYLLQQTPGFLQKDLYLAAEDSTASSPQPLENQLVQQLQGDAEGAVEQEESEHRLVNYPLHLACWIGALACVKPLTKFLAKAMLTQVNSSTGTLHTVHNLNNLMKCVSIITVDGKTPRLTKPVDIKTQATRWSTTEEDVSRSPPAEHLTEMSPKEHITRTSPNDVTEASSTENVMETPPPEPVVTRSSPREPEEGLPLELATRSGSVDCVKYLLLNVLSRQLTTQCLFYNFNRESRRQDISLHYACSRGAAEVVKLLLSSVQPTAVNSRDSHGLAPLHYALWNGDPHTVCILLENGADSTLCTDYQSTCFHVLYRSKLNPFCYEANTRLLLQFGMERSVLNPGSGQSEGHLLPLHVLCEELTTIGRTSLMLWKRNAAGILSENMGCSAQQAGESCDMPEYVESLVRCMRLLLEAGADPNIKDTSLDRKNALEVILTSQIFNLTSSYPVYLLAAISLLLEFGATTRSSTGQDNYCPCLFDFLRKHLPRVRSTSLQGQLILLFCQNGFDPDAICQWLSNCNSLTGTHQSDSCIWQPDSIRLLANLSSVSSVYSLRFVLQMLWPSHQQHPEELMPVLLVPFGKPVRCLRHMCKLAVLKCLQHRSGKVRFLHLPPMVKAYLTDNYF